MFLGWLLKIEIYVYNFNFFCKYICCNFYYLFLLLWNYFFFKNDIYMYFDIESYVFEFICNLNYLVYFEEKSCLYNCLILN